MPPFFYCQKRTKIGLNKDFYRYRGAFVSSVKLNQREVFFMAILKEYKDYLIKKMVDKYNLDKDFAETFIDEVEKKGKIEGFEEVMLDCDRYVFLYDHYFGRKNHKRIEVM